MALPWPHTTPTLPRSVAASPRPETVPAPTHTSRRAAALAARLVAATRCHPLLVRLGAVATAPLTALIVMLLGLALLFVLPLVGLPFVAVVVLPAVVYHLGAERRTALRRPRR
jgi:hypothetical protein